MIALPIPKPFNGQTFREEMSAAGLDPEQVTFYFDGENLVFEAQEEQNTLLADLLQQHDGSDTPPPIPPVERTVSELEATVASQQGVIEQQRELLLDITETVDQLILDQLMNSMMMMGEL